MASMTVDLMVDMSVASWVDMWEISSVVQLVFELVDRLVERLVDRMESQTVALKDAHLAEKKELSKVYPTAVWTAVGMVERWDSSSVV